MIKKCIVCGEEFEAKRADQRSCRPVHVMTCPDCGVQVEWNKHEPFRGCRSCNVKRGVEARKATMLARYGAPTTMQSAQLRAKMTKSLQDKYGVDNPMRCKEIQNRAKQTNLDRYGVANAMQNPEIAKKSAEARSWNMEEIKEHIKQTWLERYGVDNIAKLPETIDKITDTFQKRYGVKRAVHVPAFRAKMEASMIERHRVPFYTMTDEYRQNSHFRVSKINQKFAQLLELNHIEFTTEFSIDRKAYDFCIPSIRTLIEINPTYTHNAIGNHWNKNGLESSYHLEKTKIAHDAGYRCIHVWDWDDWDKIVAMLLPTKRVHARECTIYRLWPKFSVPFIQENHLQGSCRGQLLHLGLVKDDQIYQVMTFGRSRYDSKYDVELLRMCTKIGYHVAGGASRLFQYATQNFGIENIVSYCDLSKFSGSVYEKMGMQHVRDTQPQVIWSKENRKITANLLRARGFDQLFDTNHGKGTSNDILMIEDGWLPVYDCGQRVYEFK